MLPRLLKQEWFQANNVGIKHFANWFTENNKTETGINLGNFFNLHFEIQLGFYLEWLAECRLTIAYDTEYMWIDDSKALGTPLARGDIKKRSTIAVSELTMLEAYEHCIFVFLSILQTPF